ncbi:MAG: DUF4159 domain-containing protein, partial [Phycisphaerales bacterium]|nr:DUF4159 domain-containing protein [Phycisphaerales bacterium]
MKVCKDIVCWGVRLVCGLAVMVAWAMPAVAARPVTSDEVDAAVDKGVAWLRSQQGQNGSWDTELNWVNKQPLATTSMVCGALLECGVKPYDPRLAKALDWLEKAVDDPLYQPGGDTLGFRTQTWLLANRSSGGKYAKVMKRDIDRLVASTPSGGYDYLCTGRAEYQNRRRPDNSNSQFALYGVWAGKLNNVDISEAYWKQVLGYWSASQKPDGGWPYELKDSRTRITMAAAGLASLYVCFDSIYGPHFVPVGAEPPKVAKGMDRALAYLDFHFANSLRDPRSYDISSDGYMMYYHLFGIQRAGLATGRKRFGGVDWYDAGARVLLDMQKADGSWEAGRNGNCTDQVWTAYALMFLARGQRPLPFVHLNWGGSWNNRPHALPNLYMWMGQALERKFKLETVSIDNPTQDWNDSKILLITGHTDPQMSDQQLQRLRQFSADGGVIFSISEGNSDSFCSGMSQTYRKLFPWNSLRTIPMDHPIETIYSKLNGRVPFSVVMDGDRVLAVHTNVDLARDWQMNQPEKTPLAFEAATNVYLFVERQSKSERLPSAWAMLPVERLKQWDGVDAILAKVSTDYESQLARLELDQKAALKSVGADMGEAVGKLAKEA